MNHDRSSTVSFSRCAWIVTAAAAVGGLACGEDVTGPEGEATYLIEVSGETFRVRVTSPTRVAEFDARLQSGSEGVINGPLIGGDGGFNEPWSWHLDPAEAHTADAAIEVCDGRPSMVEADLAYWIDTLGQFCPWGAKVVEKID